MAGVSDNENKDVAVSWIKDLKPKRVLDIGAGMGIYSIMAKEPGQHWSALEVFAPYVNMFNLRSRYEEIFIADARYTDFDKLGTFDLVIAADMLEHMSKGEAKVLLNTIFEHSKYALICFPVEHQHQEAGFEGNDFETHIDHWEYDEMVDFIDKRHIVNSIKGDVLAYFLIRGDL